MKLPRLRQRYEDVIKNQIKVRFNLKNMLSVPKLLKVSISVSTKQAIFHPDLVKIIFEDLYLITGQKPVIVKSKKSIAAFKLREGVSLGAKVTLRKNFMYEFLDRFIYIALPRIRDFRGLSSTQFDGNGNYSLGIKEQTIFPEIKHSKVDKKNIGMGIVIHTNAINDTEAKFLLQQLNFPFKN